MPFNYSIIIPTLNEEKLLERLLLQLNSCKNEFNFEIIISDGGSIDGTIEIAKKFSDKVVIAGENIKSNIAAGRNFGSKFSSSDILIFLNGDIIIPDIKKFFHLIKNYMILSSTDALTFKVKISPEEETISDYLFHSFYNTYFYMLNELGIGMGRGECHIIKKNIFDAVGGYNEDLFAGEDFDLYKRLKKIGNVIFSNEFTIYESPRRYRKFGYFRITKSWLENALSVYFKNRTISQVWEEVR